jgi:hypothetical protein
MVRAQLFSGHDKENPCQHLQEFDENVFVPEHFRHDTRNTKVEIVSLLSQGKGEAMVHTCRRKYERGLGWT